MKAVPFGLAAALLVLCVSIVQLRASDDEVICFSLFWPSFPCLFLLD